MQSPLRTLVIRYRTRLAACQRLVLGGGVLAAMAASALLPSRATAQRAGGEIGVSLTILPPSELQSVMLADVRIDHDGRTPIRTAPATAARGTPVVMPRPSRDRRGSVVARHEVAPSCSGSRTGDAAHAIEHRFDVGSSSPDGTVRVVRRRLEYFVVPGT
jgi:hypothetical protein